MRIGIIGAMELEVNELISKMDIDAVIPYGGRKFYVGDINGTEVVLARCGVGKVNAGSCVQIMVDKFEIDAIINTGVAGSLDSSIDIGDFVLATNAVYHDLEATGFGYERGQVPQMDIFEFPMSDRLINIAESACKKVNPDVKLFKGRVASGDQFISAKEIKENIKKWFSPLCVEMEGAAMAHVAYLNGIECLIIRAISDKADDSAQVDYPVFEAKAAADCARMVLEMMDVLAKEEEE